MTIEPLEGDPFLLSREHQQTGEGATIYLPDGVVEKMSLEAYRAQLAEGRKAAQFFDRHPRRHRDMMDTPSSPFIANAIGWLKSVFTTIWSKIFR